MKNSTANSINYTYLYLISPLHTGGATQEGNLVGIAREIHTNLPYIPSSSIRGRLRASVADAKLRIKLFGPELDDLKSSPDEEKAGAPAAEESKDKKKPVQLEQGEIWVGDGSLLWVPVASLSHGVVWVSCPLLLRRWARFAPNAPKEIPPVYSTNLVEEGQPTPEIAQTAVYLKDAILRGNFSPWTNWAEFVPSASRDGDIQQVVLLPDQPCMTLIQMSLWQQVKVKLDARKVVEGGFRYEEAIPPDTLMYFPWGVTSQANGKAESSHLEFVKLLQEPKREILQIGGQESLGRGFVQQWLAKEEKANDNPDI